MTKANINVCNLVGAELTVWVEKASNCFGRPTLPWHELIIREWISLERPSKGQKTPVWRAIVDGKYASTGHSIARVHAVNGETAEVAVLRAYVASAFGEIFTDPAQ